MPKFKKFNTKSTRNTNSLSQFSYRIESLAKSCSGGCMACVKLGLRRWNQLKLFFIKNQCLWIISSKWQYIKRKINLNFFRNEVGEIEYLNLILLYKWWNTLYDIWTFFHHLNPSLACTCTSVKCSLSRFHRFIDLH